MQPCMMHPELAHSLSQTTARA